MPLSIVVNMLFVVLNICNVIVKELLLSLCFFYSFARKLTKNLQMIKINKLLAITMLSTCLGMQAQIFTSTGGTREVNAHGVGDPGNDNGKVKTKRAPNFRGNKKEVKDNFKKAKIPNSIINHQNFLGPGAYSHAISGMSAVKNTAFSMGNIIEQAPTNGATVITNLYQLNKYRAQIANDKRATFVFRGYIHLDKTILVGSNKVIWVDGILNYTGIEAVSFGGADFTPRGSKLDGVFSVRSAFKGTLNRVKKDGTSPEEERASNKKIIKEAKENGKKNVLIKGTKRGAIIVQLGTERDVNDVVLPKVNGIVVLGGVNNRIENLKITGAQNGVVFWGTKNASLRNTFINKSVYRGVHLHSSINSSSKTDNLGDVKNNLITNSGVDGIDVDSVSSYWKVSDNVIIGAADRFLLWTEIDVKHNDMLNNVGVILGNTEKGFQENGTEASRDNGGFFKGNRHNKWINNNIFYASELLHGITMHKKRFIQRNTITFENNYVWALNSNIEKYNPKLNITDDVYYLTGTPQTQNRLINTDLKTLDITKQGNDFVVNGEVSNAIVFEIYNMGGSLVRRGKGSKITKDGLASGIYIILINSGGELTRRKIIVE